MEHHHQIVSCSIQYIHWCVGGVLPLCRDAVRVFYSPSRQGCLRLDNNNNNRRSTTTTTTEAQLQHSIFKFTFRLLRYFTVFLLETHRKWMKWLYIFYVSTFYYLFFKWYFSVTFSISFKEISSYVKRKIFFSYWQGLSDILLMCSSRPFVHTQSSHYYVAFPGFCIYLFYHIPWLMCYYLLVLIY